MLIPIDRPLIDGRNIRGVATQEVSPAFTARHNQQPVLLLTCDTGDRVSSTEHIQAGVRPGQELLIIATNDTNKITIVSSDAGVGLTKLNGNWVVADGRGVGAWLKVDWDGNHWWETGRGNGELDASGLNAHVEGQENTATGTAAHVEGWGSDAPGNQSHSQGLTCAASGNNSHAQGSNATANLFAEHAHASGKFADQGDAQFSRVVMRIETNDDTPTEIFIDGNDDTLDIINGFSYACKVMVVGRQDDGTDHFMGTYNVLIERTGGTVALVGAVDSYENNPGGFGAGGGLPVAITADDANKSLKIAVEGLTAHNIRWVAVVEMVRVKFTV